MSTLAVDVLGTAVEIAAPAAVAGRATGSAWSTSSRPRAPTESWRSSLASAGSTCMTTGGSFAGMSIRAIAVATVDLAPQRHRRRDDRTRADPWGVRGRTGGWRRSCFPADRVREIDAHRGVRWRRARVPVRRDRRASTAAPAQSRPTPSLSASTESGWSPPRRWEAVAGRPATPSAIVFPRYEPGAEAQRRAAGPGLGPRWRWPPTPPTWPPSVGRP